MALTDAELAEIKLRNNKRKKIKQAVSEGPWEYDSWAFVHYSERIPRKRRLGILIRPMEWFDKLGKRIDEGVADYKNLVEQGYIDAEFIIASRASGPEADIDTLLAEVKRLRNSR